MDIAGHLNRGKDLVFISDLSLTFNPKMRLQLRQIDPGQAHRQTAVQGQIVAEVSLDFQIELRDQHPGVGAAFIHQYALLPPIMSCHLSTNIVRLLY